MNTADLKNHIDKMERLIELQRAELFHTRNLLGRCMDLTGGLFATEKPYDVPEKAFFTMRNQNSGLFISMCEIEGLTSEMERINKLYKELKI